MRDPMAQDARRQRLMTHAVNVTAEPVTCVLHVADETAERDGRAGNVRGPRYGDAA